MRVSVMCALDKSGAAGVGEGVVNEMVPDERLCVGVGLGDGTGVSSPMTGVGAGEAMIRLARGLL